MTVFTHLKAPCGHDSRRYDTKRRRSNFGYLDVPAVDDSLSFMLPPFSRVGSRLVSIGNKTWELWSPNSLSYAFYPGIRAPGLEVVIESDKEKRRLDGHLGRFDPTRWPQHYDARRPWLGFVRRERASLTKIENTPLYLGWVSHAPKDGTNDLGTLDTAYLLQLTSRNIELNAVMSTLSAPITKIKLAYWEDRPTQPSEVEVKELSKVFHFADAVDAVASVQRGLRLKTAWVRAMNIIAKEHKEAIMTDWLPEVPFALEELLGVWINGVREEEACWLLKHKIPCYIIHEIPSVEMYSFRDDIKLPNFSALTDVQYLSPEHDGFEHVAIKFEASINYESDRGGVPFANPVLRPEDRVGSDPSAQGWLGTRHKALEELQEVRMKPVPSIELPRNHEESFPPLERESILPITKLPLSIPEPETRSLSKDRTEWLVPPPIMAVTEGKWTMWSEYETEDEEMFFHRVYSKPESFEKVYYDRIKRREIFFIEDLVSPPGLISDVNLYGTPAPAVHFVDVSDNQILKVHSASHWLYVTRVPDRGTVGLNAPTPAPQDLPLKTAVIEEMRKLSTQLNNHLPSSSAASNTSAPSVPTATTIVSKSVPTKPRAHRQIVIPTPDSTIVNEPSSRLGRRSRTPVNEVQDDASRIERTSSKKPRNVVDPNDVPGAIADTIAMNQERNLTEENISPQSLLKAALVDAMDDNSTDSHYLCFEGLLTDWEVCCSWFYGMAASSHFVWINRMYRTISGSTQLVWLDMNSNEDACKLRGYLTHRTMPDSSLIISHFVSEATFNKAIQDRTNEWIRPLSSLTSLSDDPMEGPSRLPLEERLESPERSSPPRDVTLLHRAGVTLEERVEAPIPPRRQRGGKRHRKKSKAVS